MLEVHEKFLIAPAEVLIRADHQRHLGWATKVTKELKCIQIVQKGHCKDIIQVKIFKKEEEWED